MLRCFTLLEACRAVGGDPDLVLDAAAGAEYGHVASLVHDDLMDRDEVRRGRPSVWHQHGPDMAIVTGDLFLFQAFRLLSLCRHQVPAERVVRVLEVLSTGCIDLCLGQALETHLAASGWVPYSQYLTVIRHKTASLFRACAESGAILGGGTTDQVLALREYGEALGMAFQIADDLSGYTRDDAELRKPARSDLRNRRITLPIIHAFEMAVEPDRRLLRDAFRTGPPPADLDALHREVAAILHRSGALDRTREEAHSYRTVALERLLVLPPSEGRDSMESVARLAIRT
jgi:geranylgeranyl diphosphate synthase type I